MVQAAGQQAGIQGVMAERAMNNFYFDAEWLDFLTSLYHYKLFQLTTTDSNGRITGLLPLCYMQSPLTGRRLVSLPFSDYCPLLAEDEKSANNLVDQALELAKKKGVRYLELRTGSNEILAGRQELTSSNLYARWLVPLEADPDNVWTRLRPTARRKIKKARSAGVQFRVAERREEMREYYRLHLLTRTKKHGMPSQSLSFFLGLWDRFAEEGKIRLEFAEYEGKAISAHITAYYGKTARYMYGASDEQYNELAASYLITWESIVWGCQHNCQELDLGRTAYDNAGLMQFKRSLGAVEEPSPYYYYPAMQGLATTSETSRKYQLLTTCWRHLPLQISAPLGGYLYKHLG